MHIPKSHPRYESLRTRELLEQGVENGITSLNGLIAHGRGEAFDYLFGEKTHFFARNAVNTAAALLLAAKHPVISVNGNTAALVPDELVMLSNVLHAPLEINLFHKTQERLEKIQHHLLKHGAKQILLPQEHCIMFGLESERKYVHPDGIMKADVVFVPLEDGDRTEALVKNEKKVITVDLNPLSRTAQQATITIVDNVIRVLPLLNEKITKFKEKDTSEFKKIISKFDNKALLFEAEKIIRIGI